MLTAFFILFSFPLRQQAIVVNLQAPNEVPQTHLRVETDVASPIRVTPFTDTRTLTVR